MIDVITNLGDLALLLLSSVALVALLIWQGSAWAAFSWAFTVCLALTFVTKLAFMSLHLYGSGGNWLNVVSPSGHTSLSLVFYGGLAAVIATGRAATQRWVSYGVAALLVMAIGVTRIMRDDHSTEEVAIGFLMGSISLCFFALLRRRAQQTAIRWPFTAGLAIFVIAAAYLLSGKHLSAEGPLNRIAQEIVKMLRV